MPESIVILPARLEFAESFRLCVDSVSREKKYFLMNEAPPLERIREFLTRLNTLGHPHYFAVRGSTVMGWCNIKRIEGEPRCHVGELSMGLRVEARGQGVGRKLIEASLREARLLDYHKVELTVFTNNERAIRLYENTGFEKEGMLRHFARMNGDFRDAFVMGQLL